MKKSLGSWKQNIAVLVQFVGVCLLSGHKNVWYELLGIAALLLGGILYRDEQERIKSLEACLEQSSEMKTVATNRLKKRAAIALVFSFLAGTLVILQSRHAADVQMTDPALITAFLNEPDTVVEQPVPNAKPGRRFLQFGTHVVENGRDDCTYKARPASLNMPGVVLSDGSTRFSGQYTVMTLAHNSIRCVTLYMEVLSEQP